MSNIWDLSAQMALVDEAIDRAASLNEGEIPEELDEFFEALKTDFGMAVVPVANLMRKKAAEAVMLKAQAKVFRQEAEKLEAFNARCKQAIMVCMDATGERKAGDFTVCKNGGKLPLEFVEGSDPRDEPDFSKVEYSWDNDAIRKSLAKDGELEFVALGERGKHVRLKSIVKG